MKIVDAQLGLKQFHVYRQCQPIQVSKTEWKANLRHVGDVLAADGASALKEAQAAGMAVAPIVEEVYE